MPVPNGRNINAGCGATHPAALQAAVTAERAHAGIALDGDADRLIAVDERGDIVDGDHVIAICAGDMRDRGVLRDDTVVVTVMANLGFHIAMREAGIRVVQTDVGDRYVLEALLAGGYSLGGEQSGHVIFPDHATTGDGMLTALALLDVVQRSGKQLSQLADAAMTQLPQVLVNIDGGGAARGRRRAAGGRHRRGAVGARRQRSRPGARQRHRAADQGDGRSTDQRVGAVDSRRAGQKVRQHPELVSDTACGV